MGSTAFAAAVPYPGMATQIFCKKQRSTQQQQQQKQKLKNSLF